ncbi:unnamed protein product [Kuraishia capsulata CBS 1993]|uniref:Acyl carrier protein n=1 Tax=Kuraishia capsulata CBS 1993 TaxID=1382522 RepID=W6MIN7_9ASCO|nr:uncharacterized protein KUCA_T00001967001 [Kuraishia capsulata CBS 1993]CDK25996.1 unnamed protein product [Kuraishia capsulata CBS 1993]
MLRLSCSRLLKGSRASAFPLRVPSLVAQAQWRQYSAAPALTKDIIQERIVELFESYDKTAGKEILPSSSFTRDLGLDSLDTVEVVMEIENEFSIIIPDHEADEIKTVQQAIDFIASQDDAC